MRAQGKITHWNEEKGYGFIFWETVVLNCVAFGWLFTAQGAEMLRALVATGGIWR